MAKDDFWEKDTPAEDKTPAKTGGDFWLSDQPVDAAPDTGDETARLAARYPKKDQAPVSVLQTQPAQDSTGRRLGLGAGPISQSTAARAEQFVDGQVSDPSNVELRAARGIQTQRIAGTRRTFGDLAEVATRGERERVAGEQIKTRNRQEFAEENPILGGMASGSAGLLAGTLNVPQVAADGFNKTFVDPVLRLAGQDPMPVPGKTPGTDNLIRMAADFAPVVGQQEMGAAWDKGEFAPWLVANMAQQSPQIAQSLVAAFAPPLRAVLLPGMGAQAAGSSYIAGDDPRVAIAKGAVEIGTEMLPLQAFDKIGGLLAKLPAGAQKAVLAEAGKRVMAAGGAVTANMLTNAIEETVAQVSGNALDRYVSGKNVELTQGADAAAVLGAAAGGGMSAPQAARALVKPTDRTPQIKSLREAGDETAATLLEQRQQKEQAAYTAEVETEAIADFGPEVQQRYRETRLAGMKTGDAVVQTAARWNFEQAAKVAGLTPKAQEAISAKLAELPPEKVAGFVQKAITGLVEAGAAQPFEGMDQIAANIETQRDQMLDSVLGAMDEITQLEAQQDGPQDTAQGASETGAGTDALATPEVGAGASAVLGSAEQAEPAALSDEWQQFPQETETLGVPRAEMPQVKTVHRGPLVNFLNARGVTHEQVEVDPAELKPTQAEFSQTKVQEAADRDTDRSILISSDGHIIDGHHQAIAKLQNGKPVRAIRLDATAADLLPLVREFPSSTTDQTDVQDAPQLPAGTETQAAPGEAPAAEGGDAAAAVGVPAAGAGAGVRPDGIGKKQEFNIGGRDPHTVMFEHKDDGRLIRTVTYPDGQSNTETLVTDRNGDESWASQSAYEKGEFYPAQLSGAEASTAIRDDISGKAVEPEPTGSGDVQADGVTQAQPEMLGRNSQPISEGGTPFKTQAEAQKEKKLHPTMRVVQSTDGKGYVLKPMSPKQIAAIEKAAKRLKGVSTGEAGPMSLHHFILSAGGLSRDSMADAGFDKNQRIGNRWLFSNTGLTLAKMSERLKEAGFITEETENAVSDGLRRSLVNPVYTPEGYEAMAQAEAETRYEDHLAAQQEETQAADENAEDFDPFASPATMTDDGFGPDIEAEAGYDALERQQQAEVDALLAAAEAEGIDVETIREQAFENTQGGTNDDYRNETRALIAASRSERAQAAERARSEQGRQDAERESGGRGREDDGDQGAARSEAATLTDRPDGTLAVKGDTAVIKDRLTTAGIPAKSILPSATGVVVGKTQAAKAREVLEAPTLTAPTKADIEAQQARTEQAARDKAAADRAADRTAAQDDERKRIAKASEQAADTFELGGDAMANLTGQKDIFGGSETDPPIAKEPDAEYSQGYETDLFGEALPASNRAAAKAARQAGVRGDAQPAAPLQGDTPAPAGEYNVRTVVGTEVKRRLGAARINNFADLAQATQYLYKSAVERFDAIVTDNAGKPLAVVGGFKGAVSQTGVYPGTVIGEAVRVPGAARIWFSHNHPSGTASLSQADRFLNETLHQAFKGSGIEPMGLIAVAGKQYAATDETTGDIKPADGQTEVPVIERELVPALEQAVSIGSPKDALAIAKTYYDRANAPGIMLLDSQNRVSAWIPIPQKMRGYLRYNDGLNAIYRAVSESNAAAAIIAHGGELDARPFDGRATTTSQNIMAAMKKADVRPLDTINAKTGESAAEQGLVIDSGPVFSIADEAPPFYSELARQIEKSPMNAGAAAAWTQYLDALAKRGAVKADEVEWTGLREWLNLQPGKVTKAQIAEYLDANGVQVTETVLSSEGDPRSRVRAAVFGDLSEDEKRMVPGWMLGQPTDFVVYVDGRANGVYDSPTEQDALDEVIEGLVEADSGLVGDAKYSNYTLPGGENYREVLLTLPVDRNAADAAKAARIKELTQRRDELDAKLNGFRNPQGGLRSTEPAVQELMRQRRNTDTQLELAKKDSRPVGSYKSSHWDQPNVLAHIRVNDRVDADGRKVLFVEELQSDWSADGRKKGFADSPKEMARKAREKELLAKSEAGTLTEAENDELFSMAMEDEENTNTGASGTIPLAPFVGGTDKWLALSLKRIMKMAVDGGYDRVAFVTGEQSAERYDLSKQIKTVNWSPKTKRLQAWDHEGKRVVLKDSVEPDSLPDFIGKDATERLLSQEMIDAYGGSYNLTGQQLKVGGEGMKAFYDKIVPAAVKDVLKKVGGGQMEAVTFGVENDQYSNAARYEGQSRTADEVQALYDVAKKSGGDIYDNPLTGRREMFAINRVANEDALKRVLRSMGQGQTFEQAMLDPDIASPSFAALLGGRYAEIPKTQRKQETLTQTGFTITDAMREKVAGGLPLFSAVDAQAKAGDTPTDASPVRVNLTQAQRDAIGRLQQAIRTKTGNGAYVLRPVESVAGPGREHAFAVWLAKAGFGATVVPVEQPAKRVFNGAQAGNLLLLDVNTQKPAMAVMGHELLHQLRRDDPSLYSFLKVQIEGVLKPSATGDYAAALRKKYADQDMPELTADAVSEELIGDIVGDQFNQRQFWDMLAAKSKNWAVKIARKALEVIDRLLGVDRKRFPYETDKYLTDIEAARQVVADVLAEYSGDKTGAAGGDVKLSIASTADDIGGLPPEAKQMDMLAPNVWNAPDPTRTDRVIYELQDGRIDLKRIQQAIKAAGADIPEKFDARLAETLYPGRVATRAERFLDDEVKPLLEAMARNNVEMDELADYLHARGAKERNAQVAKVNPDLPDGGAGKNSKGVLMTNAAAAAYLAQISEGRKMALQSLASRVDSITKGTRQMLVAEGLEKQETIDAWEKAYQNYVPMFKEEAESGNPHPTGNGMSVRGSASKRAMGSTKQVTNILAHVLMQREAAITRAEKNRVAVSLYGLALTNPNRDFWTTIRPGMKPEKIAEELDRMGVDPAVAVAGMSGVPTISTVDPTLGVKVSRPNPIYKSLPGAITVRINGEDRVLMLNTSDPRGLRMAENLKNLDGLTKIDIAGSIIGKTTRWMASVNTQYNPAFGLVNLIRDTVGGSINLSSTPLRGKTLKVLALTAPALKGIALELSGRKSGEWGKLFRQFQADGGQTGYREQFKDASERTKQLAAELKSLEKTGHLRHKGIAAKLLDVLDIFNTTLENAVRLAAYREGLLEGMSRPAAARLGRELTVDFNRKGRIGREAGPLYAFFNASVQGSARTIETLKGPVGQKIITGGMMLGVMQAIMLLAAGYDDDEIPEFVKTRALIIPLPWMEGKQYLAIPLPLGLHVLPNTGRVLAELTLDGGRDAGEKVFHALGEIAGAFNPLGGGNVFTADGFLKTLAPTVLDPFIETDANKNFAGRPIERDKFGENDQRPGFERAREGTQRQPTGQAYIEISRAINTLTGGDDYEAGMASPTPEMVRYWAQVVGGGLLRETEKIVNTTFDVAQGEEVKPTGVPIFGRLYGEVDDDSVQRSRFYDNLDRISKAENVLNAAAKKGDAQRAEGVLADRPEVVLGEAANDAKASVAKLNKAAAQTIGDRETSKALDEARTGVMTGLNRVAAEIDRPRREATAGARLKQAMGLSDAR